MSALLKPISTTSHGKNREYQRKYYSTHREEEAVRAHAYNAAHREENAKRHHAYRAAHREEIAARGHAHYIAHRAEIAARDRRYREAHPGARRKINLKRQYGMTIEQYEAIYNAQEGKCAICGRHEEKLCIDHDHATNKVRGLLCQHCNTALGYVYDDPEILTSAINYLREWKGVS